jgi:hypothetical protein
MDANYKSVKFHWFFLYRSVKRKKSNLQEIQNSHSNFLFLGKIIRFCTFVMNKKCTENRNVINFNHSSKRSSMRTHNSNIVFYITDFFFAGFKTKSKKNIFYSLQMYKILLFFPLCKQNNNI